MARSPKLLITLLLLGLGWPRVSVADDRKVVILPFTGPKAAAVRDLVVGAFKVHGRVKLVRQSDFFDAGRMLGYSRRDLSDPLKLSLAAAEARVDAVVRGSVERQGRSARLYIRVLDGGSGESLGLHRFRLVRGRADRALARRVVALAVPSIMKARWRPVAPSGGGITRSEVSDSLLDGEQQQQDGYAPVEGLAGSRFSGAALSPVAVDLEDPGDSAADPILDLLRIEVGLVGMNRSYSLLGGLTENNESLPIYYDAGVFPGLWLHAEAFPLALAGEKGGIRNLGIEAYTQLGFLDTEMWVRDEQGGQSLQEGVETDQSMWGVGLMYRLCFLFKAPDPACVRLLAGYHGSSFEVLNPSPGSYRQSDYGSLRVGVDASVPLFGQDSWLVLLRLRGAGLMILSSSLNNRRRYPSALGQGWELAAGMEFDSGKAWLLAVDYRAYRMASIYGAAGRPELESSDLYHGFVVKLAFRH